MKNINLLLSIDDNKSSINRYIYSKNRQKTNFYYCQEKKYNKCKIWKFDIYFIKKIYFFIVIFSILPILTNEFILIYHKSSYITLKIYGEGKKRVFYEKDNDERCLRFVPPDEVYINNIKQNLINFEYNFNETKNIVKLVWNKEAYSIPCMFSKCSDIKEIDFSYFKFSLNSGDIGSMFNGCTSLISVDLSNLTKSITYINYLFYNCKSLTSINLTNFDTSKIQEMQYIFFSCSSLKSINLSSFKTPELLNTKNMFQNCILLTSIDISNFDLKKITELSNMFNNCRALKMIKFPNSKTPNLVYIGSLFTNCISLVSVDFSNFITSKVKNMYNMFHNCKSLTSIDLSNFDTSNARRVESMFEGCSNLQYINLQKAKQTTKKNIHIVMLLKVLQKI